MKKWLVLALLIMMSGTIQAAGKESGSAYILPKINVIMIDDGNNADPLFGLGLMLGYGLSPDLAVELEYNRGFYGGEFVLDNSNDKGFHRFRSYSAFAAYRFPVAKIAYIKGRLGVSYEIPERAGKNPGNEDFTSNMTLSGGGGFGFVYEELFDHQFTFELEYTQMEQHIGALALAVHVQF
ncbi:MAG: porin family protein [Gammaproteobacteria bacterium]|nr:porin family protein [Gammaproteobacteria bacterium]